jgi:Protein of unknown function (DUF3618)
MDEGTREERTAVTAAGGPEGGSPSPEQLREEIARTRAELGDTVEALAERSDVKGQAQERVADAKESVRRKREELTAKARGATPESTLTGGRQVAEKVRRNPAPVAIAGAVLAGFALGRRSSR